MPELQSEFPLTIRITLDKLHDFVDTPYGTLHTDMLGEGSFEGPKLRGKAIGVMDQKIFRSDGAMNPNIRFVLRAEDDAFIYMHYTGIRHGSKEVMEKIAEGEAVDPTEYYLRNTLYFKTSASQYDWLNRIVSVGVGLRMPDHAVYGVFQIL
jgi:hypothetical protein